MNKRTVKIKKPTSDKIFDIVNTIFLLLMTLIVLYPLIYVLSASFSSGDAVISGKVFLLPVEPTIIAYVACFNHKLLLTSYANSIFITIVGTSFSLLMTIFISYPLSRRILPGKNFITGMFLFTMLFNGGLIPYFMIVSKLGMYDTRAALIVPCALSVYNMIIMRTYMSNSIPASLYEAAEIDGCGPIKTLFLITLPLSKPILAVISLYFAIGYWNSYFQALIFLQTDTKYPLQIVLRDILILNKFDPTMLANPQVMLQRKYISDILKYSIIVVASAPLLMVYPFIQKFFIKGVMIGSVKG